MLNNVDNDIHIWDKRKSAFEHVQNIQIQTILHMFKVSSGLCSPSVHSNYSANALIRCMDAQTDFGCRYICSKTRFRIAQPMYGGKLIKSDESESHIFWIGWNTRSSLTFINTLHAG